MDRTLPVKAKCPCGVAAETEIILQSGGGLGQYPLCLKCRAKVYEHAQAILTLTGAEKYALAPMLRPTEKEKT